MKRTMTASGTIEGTQKILEAACHRAGAADCWYSRKELVALENLGLVQVRKSFETYGGWCDVYEATDEGRVVFSTAGM